MCVVNLKSVNKLDLTWKQSFLIMINYSFNVEKFVKNQSLFVPSLNKYFW